jgi:hypothetical protein
MNKKLASPRTTLIERTALEFAAVFYDVGRSQGLTSKHKSARYYAAHNFIKFIPRAVSHLIDILNQPNASPAMKHEIWTALQERIHDDDTTALFDNKLPDIDLTKVLDCKPEPPIIVNTKRFEHVNSGDTAALMKGNANG